MEGSAWSRPHTRRGARLFRQSLHIFGEHFGDARRRKRRFEATRPRRHELSVVGVADHVEAQGRKSRQTVLVQHWLVVFKNF